MTTKTKVSNIIFSIYIAISFYVFGGSMVNSLVGYQTWNYVGANEFVKFHQVDSVLTPYKTGQKSENRLVTVNLGKYAKRKKIIHTGRAIKPSSGSRAGRLYGNLPQVQFITLVISKMETALSGERIGRS